MYAVLQQVSKALTFIYNILLPIMFVSSREDIIYTFHNSASCCEVTRFCVKIVDKMNSSADCRCSVDVQMNLETCRAFATRLMQTIHHTSFAQ